MNGECYRKMKEIGEYLKNRRLELGISLEDAEQYLKIRKKYLVAIEEGDESVLPGRTYFVGYLRNYANYLDADQEYVNQLLEKTEQKPKVKESEYVAKKKKPGRYFSPEKRKFRMKREKKSFSFNFLPIVKILIIIVLIGGMFFVVNQLFNRIKRPSVPVAENEIEIGEIDLNEEKTLEQELLEIAEENILKEELSEKPDDSFLAPLPEYKPITIITQEPTWVRIIQGDDVLFESVILNTEEITIRTEEAISILTTATDDTNIMYDNQVIEPEPHEHHRLMRYQIVPDNEN